ncbi:hypothetical protein MMC34_003546 [Xylographa carneopallida]|nr:hypothetical protein [Xylographa carneopallida]
MPAFKMLLIFAIAAVAYAANSSLTYAPTIVSCPENQQWIRPAGELSSVEAQWLYGRKRVVLDAFSAYLERLKLEDFDVCKYTRALKDCNYAHVPTIGFGISGGGAASAFTGAGGLRALDARIPGTTEQRVGGLLQSISYISGLSGGGWPTVGFATYDFLNADDIIDQWKPELNRFNATNNTEYAITTTSLFEELAEKYEAGFNVTAADFFGRAWGYEFTPPPRGGLNLRWSGIINMPSFKNFTMPLPILELCVLEPNDIEYFDLELPSPRKSFWEATPFEFGNWDGPTPGFIPTEYMGTPFNNGSPTNAEVCVRNFDKPSFLMGAAAAAFNAWYIGDKSNNTLAAFPKRSETADSPSGYYNHRVLKRFFSVPLVVLDGLIAAFQQSFGLDLASIAYNSIPNPFAGTTVKPGQAPPPVNLSTVDPAESGQALPLWPQIQPARKMNLLIAWDDDEDAVQLNWNNGTNLYNTYLAANASGLPFPIVPFPATFINRNYTARPVFFGCNASLTTTGDERSPIVLYVANAPYSAYTNYSAAAQAISRVEIHEIFVNSLNLLTQGNGTLAADWVPCLGCAAIERSLSKVGMRRTGQCEACFRNHCWDGVEDDRPTGVVDLPLALDPGLSFAVWNLTHPFVSV